MNSRQDGAPSHAEGAAEAGLVGGRFRIERSVGRGGMATVHEVVDVASERRLALKRLHVLEDAKKRRRSTQLFEREFHTLAHLAHPRVVAVYDYGVDEQGPFYTMELLDGGDLQQQAPVPWKRACALARDICSALSLLHSRRMVYRDLSPRNVRCTSDGFAKLIDFGAMIMMGPSKQVVGTPAYCAPETLNLQPLDQRTDLYSLGATLYYTLVGRHAYPARDFMALRDVWRSRIVPPSAINPEIPAGLDALVLDLMHLDPAARPANAAEVMERLAAIEGRALDEHLLVSQSYLSTPNLVGRDVPQSRARAKMMRAMRGRGGAVAIQGASGVGRSRFLDACLLDAKLLGALVLRADASDAHGDYAVVRSLAAQLIEAAPEQALAAARPKLPILGHAVPELLVRGAGTTMETFENPEQVRAHVQPALREWLLEVSRARPLMVAVDDVHAIDEPSAAFLALLAHDVRRGSVLVAVTIEPGAAATAPTALGVFTDAATKIKLANLTLEHGEKLLRSVFGDVARVQYVAHRLHAISEGNPRDLMQLAQHLVDKGLVRYQAGAWTLPASIDAGELPSSMAQALKSRIDALGAGAREIAAAMALCPERSMSFDECVLLSGGGQPARVMQSVDELVEAQVVSFSGESYAIARRVWTNALRAEIDAGAARVLHVRIAGVFERRGDEGFRVAQHLLRAGELERGVDALVKHADESQRVTHQNPDAFYKLAQSMPADWYASYDQAIALCKQLARPRSDAHMLRSRLAGFCGLMGILDRTHMPALLAELAEESGLCDWEALDPGMEPMARLTKALEATQARYTNRAAHERVLEPIFAIRHLARASIEALGIAIVTRDTVLFGALPSLAPLEPLSPALVAVSTLIRGSDARLRGRLELAQAEYDKLLEFTARPDRAGLEASHHRYMCFGVMCGMGFLQAGLGLDSSLEWARKIEHEPSHQVNALLIQMLYYLWQGQIRDADHCKERIELLRIQNSPRQWFEGGHLLGQVLMHAAVDDLTRVKQTTQEIEQLARRYPGWEPVHHYGTGEYHRIRGDHVAAAAEFERGLAITEPGCHQVWPNLAGAYVRAMCDQGRADEACIQGGAELARAERAGHGVLCEFIRMPLAVAQARARHAAAAVASADHVIAKLQAIGSKGVLLALAYETRARVAVHAQDQAGFARFAALCAEQLRAGSSRVLTAKFEKLKQLAVRADIAIAPELADAAAFTEQLTGSQLTSLLDGCRGATERAQQALNILLNSSGAAEGFLFLLSENGPELAAKVGELARPDRVASFVREYLNAELRDQDVRTSSMMLDSAPMISEMTGMAGERYRPVLLSHPVAGGFAITGVAIAVLKPGRRFAFPGPLAIQLSRILHDAGDVAPSIVSA